MLKLLAFVLPLGLDSFAVAAAIGAAGTPTWRLRLRISLIFVVFEAGMPLVGLAAGRGLARVTGPVADYVAATAVIVVGIWMLVSDSDAASIRARVRAEMSEQSAADRLAATRGLAVV